MKSGGAAPPAYRRNVAALMADVGGYGTGVGFINPVTVLPVLVRQLTSSALVVGLMTTVWMGSFLLPQMFAGRWLSDKPRKRPYLLWFANTGRLGLPLPAVLCAVLLPNDTVALLAGVFAGIAIFRLTDSVAGVAWFDVMSRAIPLNRRGRVLGAGQILAGVGAIGAALVVRWALSEAGPAFPRNFSLLFGLTLAGIAISSVGLFMLVEPASTVEPETLPMDMVEHARHVVRSNRLFRQVTLVRLMSGATGLAVSFFAVHATRELGLPQLEKE
jgi:hypothetical protein